MEKHQEVTALPKLIDPMDSKFFATIKENRHTYEQHLLDPVIDHPYEGADLVSKGNSYLVLDHNKKRVVYLMRWETRTILSRKSAYQVIVWSEPGDSKIRGYAPKIFFEHLFNKIKLICADRLQTPNRKRFWTSVVNAAL